MDRRRVTDKLASNVSQAIVAAGTDTSTTARAAEVDAAKLQPSPNEEMTLGELVRIGGALRVSPGELLAGVA